MSPLPDQGPALGLLLLTLAAALAFWPTAASPPPMVQVEDGAWVPLNDPGADLRHGDRLAWQDGAPVRRPPARPLVFGQPLDLNLASASDLEAIPGVGPALAARIVAHREARGRIGSVDELDEVKGVGPATLARVRPWVEVGP